MFLLISDSWSSFAQNEKTLEAYYARIESKEIPVFRGHHLSKEDLIIRKHILNLMCHFETSWATDETYFEEINNVLEHLKEMEQDDLIYLNHTSYKLQKRKSFCKKHMYGF